MHIDQLTLILSATAVAGHVGLAFLLLYLLYRKFFKKRISAGEDLLFLFSKYAVALSFVIALVAVLGSLFFSEVAHYLPCTLCWYQRILMYPLVIIFAVALYKKDRNVSLYALPLAVFGLLIAIYHYVAQMIYAYTAIGGLTKCSVGGLVPSCEEHYFLEFGYITFPMLSITTFAFIILFMVLLSRRKRSSD